MCGLYLLFKRSLGIKTKLDLDTNRSLRSSGWISANIPSPHTPRPPYFVLRKHLFLDATKSSDCKLYFLPNSIDNILSEHMLEHLNNEDLLDTLKIIHHFLAYNGIFRVAVPDGSRPDANYINQVKPPNDGPSAAFYY